MDQDESAAEQRSIVLALDGETHTLGNALRDVMWAHPHVELASYTQEHPSVTEIILRCQTNAAISAEQGVVEGLHMMRAMLGHMSSCMADAAAAWEARHGAEVEDEERQAGQLAEEEEEMEEDE